ncbi:SpoIID/LytB domain-containing protein [Cellulomonas sp.]|uniref:SpoIID/LytB domain-containing protein n=1 Tax=Cellulomonas sp. TaxID=40001 RepID=UPI0028109E3E|nr:SpoIID/LytB domain-containing protein [Cellulomonas sp.]
MRTSSPRRPLRTRAGAVVALLVAALAAPFTAAVPPAHAADTELVVTGRGWGHGRGMGQWGALGYAVDHGWSAQRILQHYYGNTTEGNVGNPEMTVELLSLLGKPLVVTGPGLTVTSGGRTTSLGAGTAALRLTLSGSTVRVERGTGCVSAWTPVSGTFAANDTRVASTASPSSIDNLVRVCEAAGERAYRGALSVVNHGGQQMTVNHLPTEAYLRGVVPRESPAGWASAGNGRGIEALKAQAVAARSYALSSRRPSGALTCDTTTCQVYGGAGVKTSAWTLMEDARADAAIAATAGSVRLLNGAVARTEFSSSTGGHTAGGVFPAVVDLGDAVAGNPRHTWSIRTTYATAAARLGTGPIRSIDVTGRNGLGADGGRVTQVTVRTTAGTTHTFSGNAVRSALGLYSDWFSFAGASEAQAQAVVRALYQDVLGRAPDPGGLATWTGMVTATGDARVVARGIVMSTERLHTFVRAEYASALKRAPEAAGLDHWTRYLQGGTSVPELQVYIYGSDEALLNLGGGDLGRWVDGMYRGILGRAATAQERAYWTDVARRSDRPTVVHAIAMSDEAGLRRLDSYYATMLGRRPDPTGIATFLPLMRGNGDFLLPIEIGGSPEYWARAQLR